MAPGTFRNDCVPTAFHYLSGRPFPEVLEICIRVGHWTAQDGAYGFYFKDIAKELGITLGSLGSNFLRHEDGSCMTTKTGRLRIMTVGQFIRNYPKGKYMVHTHDHVFAVIDGKNFDHARTGLKARIFSFQEVVQAF